ncbi:MAG TPA: MFS transporter [Acidimicrobiia bacterium]
MTERRTPEGFWAVWTAVAMDLLGFGIIIPLLPLYADSFGATATTIGILFASYSLAQFVLSPVWGRISDRVGRKPVLVVTIVGSAIGSLTLGLAGSLTVLFIGRIIDGASGASVAVARAAVADVATPEQRPRLMGLLGAAFGFGFVIGPVVGSLAALGGPEIPFFLAAAISAANAIATWIRVPESRVVTAAGASSGSIRDLSGTVARLVVLTFVGITAFGAFEATFSLLAEVRLGLGEAEIGFVFAGLGVLLVATQGGLIGPATRLVGERQLIRVGLVLNVVGFLMLSTAESWALLIPGLAILALGQGFITPALASAIAGSAEPGRSGAALGVQQSAGGLARVVGPAMGGALFAIELAVPYVVAAGLTLAALPIVPRRGSVEEMAAPER